MAVAKRKADLCLEQQHGMVARLVVQCVGNIQPRRAKIMRGKFAL